MAIAALVAAWFVGALRNRPESPTCQLDLFPGATDFRPLQENVFEGVSVHDDGTETVIGWATVASASGYAGPIRVMVSVNAAGEIMGVKLLDQSETASFFARIEDREFLAQFTGMDAVSPFRLDEDIDAVTSATKTSAGIANTVQAASYQVAERKLGFEPPAQPAPPIEFGVPEIALILLYAAGFFGHRPGFPHKKLLRWGMLLAGIAILGFAYNVPLTIAHINSFLIGFWPDWRTDLYWYLLLGGIFFVVTVDGKNPYCQWFCPFGATQECLAAIGGGRFNPPRRSRLALRWVQRGLAWLAIFLALLFRNPGLPSYEVFGTLFAFNGTTIQWAIVIIILVVALFVRRPWCNFLCPLPPVIDLITVARKWIRTWRKDLIATLKKS